MSDCCKYLERCTSAMFGCFLEDDMYYNSNEKISSDDEREEDDIEVGETTGSVSVPPSALIEVLTIPVPVPESDFDSDFCVIDVPDDSG